MSGIYGELTRRAHEGYLQWQFRRIAMANPSLYFALTRFICKSVGHSFNQGYLARAVVSNGQRSMQVQYFCTCCLTSGPWISLEQRADWVERHGIALASNWNYRVRKAYLRLTYGLRTALRLQPDQNEPKSVYTRPPL